MNYPSMMKITVASDLHSDMQSRDINWQPYAEECDIVVIAGDTSNSVGQSAKILNKIAKKFRYVIATSGNHEMYANGNQDRGIDESDELLAALVDPNVTILRDSAPLATVMGQTFIGMNGWYSLDMDCDVAKGREIWKNRLKDNRWTKMVALTGHYPDYFAAKSASIVEATLAQYDAERDGRAIVVTHTAPTGETLWKKPHDPSWDEMNCCYANLGIGRAIAKYNKKVAFAVHGHTHMRQDRDVSGVRYVVNPRGYSSENPNWTPIVIEI